MAGSAGSAGSVAVTAGGFTAAGSSILAGPGSEMRRDVRAAPVHKYSEHVVAHLAEQIRLGAPNLNALQYGVSVYEVDDSVPPLDVQWSGHTGYGDALYAGLLGIDPRTKGLPWPVTSLSQLPDSVGPFRGVPIPDGARPAVGSDGALAVLRTSTGQLWEHWQARQDPTSRAWSAAWGGYVANLAAHDGRYSGGLGVSASGLVAASGVVRIAEAAAGLIEHAVGIAVPHVVGGRWSYPASRCDALPATSTAPFALHEGQRFRLRSSVDVATLTRAPDWRGRRAPVHPVCRVIAQAAQQYGLVVNDQTGSVVIVTAEEGRAAMHAQAVLGVAQVNPWQGILAGAATWQVLDGFPWDQLEALPHDWR